MDHDFGQLIEMVCNATLKITDEYFQLPVANADAVYRERVYCYELYHQLRCLWNDFPYSLSGEVDKDGNPVFCKGPYSKAKPDLLVHEPGRMDKNLAAIEVKPATTQNGLLVKDLQKLRWFCDNAQYFRGIVLVYGVPKRPQDISMRLRQLAINNKIDTTALICLYHRIVGQRSEVIALCD